MIINTPISINGRVLNNRVILQPMEGCDGKPDGSPSALTERRYERFARSRAAVIWVEAIAVSAECRANPRQLRITPENTDTYSRLVEKIKETTFSLYGFEPLVVFQLTNSGRFSKPDGTPAPIVAYRNELWEKGKENLPYVIATDDYCDGIIEKYARAVSLSCKAGADAVDVKCCHGYLMNEFLSAYNREGRYGGSFENRTAFYLGCIKAAKASVFGNAFVTSRLNATDTFPYPYGFGVSAEGIDLTETKKLITLLEKEGISLINITLGNPYLIPDVNRPWRNGDEDPQVGMKRIYSVTKELQTSFPGMNIVMSGLSYPAENCIDYADKCLEQGVASLAGFGRMSFAYPEFYNDYRTNGSLKKNKCCIACGKCTALMRGGSVTGCPVRDSAVYMQYYRQVSGADSKA